MTKARARAMTMARARAMTMARAGMVGPHKEGTDIK